MLGRNCRVLTNLIRVLVLGLVLVLFIYLFVLVGCRCTEPRWYRRRKYFLYGGHQMAIIASI